MRTYFFVNGKSNEISYLVCNTTTFLLEVLRDGQASTAILDDPSRQWCGPASTAN